MSGILGIVGEAARNLSPELITSIKKCLSGHTAAKTRQHAGSSFLLLESSLNGFEEFPARRDEPLGLALVLDGRLDNRNQWIETLPSYHTLTERASDTEILFAAYQENAEKIPELLRGDFAFGLWDASKQKVLLARDIFGTRPLYYILTRESFYFSSSISALLKCPGIVKKAETAAIAGLLVGQIQDSGLSFFSGIRQVPAASQLSWQPGAQPRIERYWNPPASPVKDGPEDCKEHFFDLFLQSLRRRLRTSRPVGSLLSGGLDSTQVTAGAAWLMRRELALTPRLVARCWITQGYLKEEEEALEFLREHYNLATEKVTLPPATELRSNMEAYLEVGETPHLESFTMPSFLLKPFHAQGCQRILTGIGGNELGNYSETGHLEDLLCRLAIPSFFTEAKRYASSLGLATIQVISWITKETMREFTPLAIRSAWKRSYHHSLKWLKPSLLADLPERSKAQPRYFSNLSSELCYRQLTNPWLSLGLNQIAEAGARHRLELTHPFLDRDLVEYFLRVPGSIKIREGYRKMFFQTALRHLTGNACRTDHKEIEVIEDSQSERSAAFQKFRLKIYLSNEDSAIYNHVDYKSIQNMLCGSDKIFWKYHSMLWRLVRLQSWFRHHF